VANRNRWNLISPLAGITPTKPSLATLPLPGIQPILVDPEGKELKGNGVEGILCIKFRGPECYEPPTAITPLFSNLLLSFSGLYLTGDGAKRDEEGYYRIIGGFDDVINVSGHRIGLPKWKTPSTST
jgi:acetyl-CoA synthetase